MPRYDYSFGLSRLLLLEVPAAAWQMLPIDGALCSFGLDSGGFPSGEFKIDANGYYNGYSAPSPTCEITKVEDIGDGWMLVEDACGDSFDLNVQGDTATAVLADGHAYVRPLIASERDAMLAEAKPPARLYGAIGAPTSQAELDTLFEAMKPRLAASPVVFEFLEIMTQVSGLPAAARLLQRLPLKAAVEILPPWVRERLVLGAEWSFSAWERALVRTMAEASERIILPSSPAVQSCRRLGLADDYLYGRLSPC